MRTQQSAQEPFLIIDCDQEFVTALTDGNQFNGTRYKKAFSVQSGRWFDYFEQRRVWIFSQQGTTTRHDNDVAGLHCPTHDLPKVIFAQDAPDKETELDLSHWTTTTTIAVTEAMPTPISSSQQTTVIIGVVCAIVFVFISLGAGLFLLYRHQQQKAQVARCSPTILTDLPGASLNDHPLTHSFNCATNGSATKMKETPMANEEIDGLALPIEIEFRTDYIDDDEYASSTDGDR